MIKFKFDKKYCLDKHSFMALNSAYYIELPYVLIIIKRNYKGHSIY